MTVVKRFGVLSLGKVLAALYAALGLIVGGFFSLIALVGASASRGGQGAEALVIGLGAIIFLPIIYGFIGFITGIIAAALYNVIVPVVGGIEMDLEHAPPPAYPASDY